MANFLTSSLRKCGGLRTIRFFSSSRVAFKNEDPFDEADKKMKEARDLLENLADRGTHWEYHQKGFGSVYDKKPFKVLCKEGKMYMWCACGWSKSQPFCDGTHAIKHFKIDMKPIPFKCTETKEYWFCNCKQTKRRPFCDGTHKLDSVQKGFSVVKANY